MSKAKIISKRSEDNIMGEKNILSKINHPFIVNMHFSFQDSENLYLIIDYLSGGDLRYHLSHRKSNLFNEHQTKFFLCNIIIALEYIHGRKIIHRDVKPENLLLDDNGYLRLTDFGIAVHNKKENSKESNGTAGYVAPEVLLQQGYSYCSDFFALGVIGYEFMQGTRPYYTANKKEIKDLILVYQPKIKANEMKKGWSENSRDFINKLLQRRPIKRLGYTGIKELKNHIWLKDINWDLLKNKKIKSPFIPKEGKEYFEKKYCEIDKIHDNDSVLINVKGYQHVFENYTYINLNYCVEKNKENTKQTDKINTKRKDSNQEIKRVLYDFKKKIKYPDYKFKSKSTSLLKLNEKNYNNKKNEQNKEEDKNKYNHSNKRDYNQNISFLNFNGFLYNSNNNLRRFYDLGISNKNKEKKTTKNKIKNNSCLLNKNKEKARIFSKEIKKLIDMNLVNKYSKKLNKDRNEKNKFIFNKTCNNNNDHEHLMYSTTKKTTKEKTTNIITESQKKVEIKKSNDKLNVNNYEKKTFSPNNIKKNIIKEKKKLFSKSQVNINIKDKKNSLISLMKKKDNKISKIQKHNIKIDNQILYTKNTMSDVDNKQNKRYISVSIHNNHFKSTSNISNGKKYNNISNKKIENTFNSNQNKSNNLNLNQKKEKKQSIKNYIKKKKKILSADINKVTTLKFDDYFKNTGLTKDNTQNNFFILDKFKSI